MLLLLYIQWNSPQYQLTSMLGGSRAKSGEFRDSKSQNYNIHMEVHKPEFVIQNTIFVSDSLIWKFIHVCCLCRDIILSDNCH